MVIDLNDKELSNLTMMLREYFEEKWDRCRREGMTDEGGEHRRDTVEEGLRVASKVTGLVFKWNWAELKEVTSSPLEPSYEPTRYFDAHGKVVAEY